MKRMTIMYGIVALLALCGALLCSCALSGTITVTIYNPTSINSGTLTLIYGDYSGYADGQQDLTNPTFPYTFTLNYSAKCPGYIVYASLAASQGSSTGYAFFDTTAGGDREGAMNLSLYLVTGSDVYEPDNSFAAASVIQSGEYQARSLTNSADVDYIAFYADAGRHYDIATSIPSSSSNNTVLYLYDSTPANNQLAYDYNSGSSYGESLISWTAPSTGVYYIMVDGYYVSSYGSYGLSLSSSSPGNSLISPLLKLNHWIKR